MNIVLDLDLTLIYAESENSAIICRPHLKEFLEFVFANCQNVSIWTFACPPYADKVIKIVTALIPSGNEFDFIWMRDKCEIRREYIMYGWGQTVYAVKPLAKLYNTFPRKYNELNTLILDDNPRTYEDNAANAIFIKQFDGDNENDTELLRIIEILKQTMQ